ncbi:hypothetical protein EG329_007578 [Mollisiaceae sp. DMI_Dod_QoI]|nr:hypothetical protein EG329_007578 [Helotiales sp. DMI_Dod_QoI]
MSRVNRDGFSPGISQSKFGDYARVHQGNSTTNNYFPTNSKIHADADIEFLDALSSINPHAEKAAYEAINNHLSEGAFDWVLEQEGYKKWHDESTRSLLWIKDDTGKGATTMILRILHHLERQDDTSVPAAPLLGYCFCYPTKSVNKTIEHVLEGLLHVMLSSNRCALEFIRKKHSESLPKSTQDPHRFFTLSKILQDTLNHESFKDRQVYLVIDGFDQLIADGANRDGSALLDLIKSTIVQNKDTKWIVSSNDKCAMRAGLDQFMASIDVEVEQLAHSLGLSEALDVIQNYGLQMAEAYKFFRSQSCIMPQSLEWVRYTVRGNSWLNRRSPLGSGGATHHALLWYYPENLSRSSDTPSDLGLHITELLNETDSVPSIGSYFSFHYLQTILQLPLNVKSLPIHPELALWSLFTLLTNKCCHTPADLSRLLVGLSRDIQSVLRDVCSKAANLSSAKGQELTSLAFNDHAPQNESFVDGFWLSMFDDSYLLVLMSLIESLAQLPVANTGMFLLVIDSFHLVDRERWSPCVRLLNTLGNSGSFRVFLTGGYTSKDSYMPQLGDVTIDAASCPISETTEYEEFLEKLKFDEMHSRRDQVARALPGTNEWLWSNKAYRQWISDGGVLWISGKAGSGKSVLAKSISLDFPRVTNSSLTTNAWFVCDWFYSKRGQEIGTSHMSMLRALVYEILNQHRLTFDSIKQYYREIIGMALHHGHFSGWPLETLKKMLFNLAASPSMPQTLAVIDALDESKEGDVRQQVMNLLFEVAFSTYRRLHLIILSRPEPKILESFQDCFHIIMQDNNQGDIDRLINAGLSNIRHVWQGHLPHSPAGVDQERDMGRMNTFNQSRPDNMSSFAKTASRHSDRQKHHLLPRNEEEELERIRQYLTVYSGGVILWVRLVLQQLQLRVQSETGFSIKALRQILVKLPKELDDLYAYIIESLNIMGDRERLDLARRILLWAVGSRSGDSLQLQDLLDAISIPKVVETQEIPQEDVISIERLQIGHNWSRFCNIIYQHCGPLVEIVESQNTTGEHGFGWRVEMVRPTWTIQLSHQTVKSFLENPCRSGQLYMDEAEAKLFVLRQSKKYLQLVLPKSATFYSPTIHLHRSKQRTIVDLATITEPRERDSYELTQDSVISDNLERHSETNWTELIEYLADRPFLRYALQTVRENKDDEGWVEDTILQIDEDAILVNCSFPLWWAFDSYYPSNTVDGRNYLAEFAMHACLRAEPVPIEILISFWELFEVTYGAKRGLIFRTQTARHRVKSLVEGTVDAFLFSASNHRTCCYPISTAVAETYGGLDESLETCSIRAVNGRLKENPKQIALANVVNRKIEDQGHIDGHPFTPTAAVYEEHCKLEEDWFKDSKGRSYSVPIERQHEAIQAILSFAGNYDLPGRDELCRPLTASEVPGSMLMARWADGLYPAYTNEKDIIRLLDDNDYNNKMISDNIIWKNNIIDSLTRDILRETNLA